MRALPLVLALHVMLVAATPARAQDDDPPPAGGETVVATTPAGDRLLVSANRRGDLCLRVQMRDRRTGSGGGTCGAAPRRPGDDVPVLIGDGRGGTLHGGVVRAEVASVHLRFAGEPDVRAATVAPRKAVAGVRDAGALRFYLTRGPGESPWLLRYLDAGGKALAADEGVFETPTVGRPLALQRAGGERLRAVRRLRLGATPLQRDRLVVETCVTLAPSERFGSGTCFSADAPIEKGVEAQPGDDCGQTRLPVVAAAEVRRVVAVLGDGRRVRVPLTKLPPAVGQAGSAGGLVVRGAVAIRRLEAFGAGPRPLHVLDLRTPPAPPCERQTGSGSSFAIFTLIPDDRGPLGLSVRDNGARLCLSLGLPEPDGLDCFLPPVQPERSEWRVRRADGRLLVAGVFPPDVATVDVEVDGAWRSIATTGDVPGYSGQYRGVSRFVTLELPEAARIGGARLRDARGEQLSRERRIDFRTPRPVVAGTVRVGGIALRLVRYEEDDLGLGGCVALPGDDLEDCLLSVEETVAIEALCTPRRLVFAAVVPPTTRRAEVRTSAGRLPARLVDVRGKRVMLAVVGARASVREVVVHGRAPRRAPIRLPAAGRQCGYSDFASLDLLGGLFG